MAKRIKLFIPLVFLLVSCNSDSEKSSSGASARSNGQVVVTGTLAIDGSGVETVENFSFSNQEVKIIDDSGKTIAKTFAGNDGSYVLPIPGQLATGGQNSDGTPSLRLAGDGVVLESVVTATKDRTVLGIKFPIEGGSGVVDLGIQQLEKITAIRGQANLDGALDHTGIVVYIPGTSFSARTDSSGQFLMTFLSAGEYELVFEKDGYLKKTVRKIVVNDKATTLVDDVSLKLSGGASTFFVEQIGTEGLSKSRTVEFLIKSGDADRFRAGLKSKIAQIEYQKVPEVFRYTFENDGEFEFQFIFANADGFESTVERLIIVDTKSPSAGGVKLADRSSLSVQFTNETFVIAYHTDCNDIDKVAIMAGVSSSKPPIDEFIWNCNTSGSDSNANFKILDVQTSFSYTLWAMDVVGNISKVGESSSIVFDDTPPSPPSMTLTDQTSNSSLGTDITTVDVTLDSCNDIESVLISESQLLPPEPNQFADNCSTTSKAYTYTFANNIAGNKGVLVWAVDFAGNVGQVSGSASMELDQTPPEQPPTFTLADPTSVNGGYTNDRDIEVIPDSCAGITHILAAESQSSKPDENDNRWEECGTITYSILGGEGLKTVYLWSRDIGGNVSNLSKTADITLDEIKPDPSGFTIFLSDTSNGSQLSTNSLDISVDVSPCNNDASKVYITETSNTPNSGDFAIDCSGGSLTTTYSIQSSSQGSKTVNIWLQDVAGNISLTASQKNIDYDTVVPPLPSAFNVADRLEGSTSFTNETSLVYTIDSCTNIDYISIKENQSSQPGENDISWMSCGLTAELASLITANSGARTVYLWTKDEAGNISGSLNHTIGWDASAPSQAVGSSPANWGILYTKNDPASISGTGEANGTLMIENTTTALSYETPINGAGSWSYLLPVANNQSNSIKIKIKDEAGNVGGDIWIYINHDTIAPQTTAVAHTVTDTTVNLSWTISGELTDKYLEWGPTLSYGTVVQDTASFSSTQTVLLSSLTENTTYYYKIKSTDKAGNYDSGNDFVGSFKTYINKSGTISANQIWSQTDTAYYIPSIMTINTGVTLQIDPGVVVKLASNVSIINNGTIKALGTLGSEIEFSPNTVNPSSAFWNSINFTSSSPGITVSGSTYVSGSIFQYVNFSYGGSSNPLLDIDSSGLLIDNCSFDESGSTSSPIVDFTGDSNIYIWNTTFNNPERDTVYSSTGGGGVFEYIGNTYKNTSLWSYKTAINLNTVPATVKVQNSYFEGYNGSNSANERSAVRMSGFNTVYSITGNTFNGTGNNDYALFLKGSGAISNNIILGTSSSEYAVYIDAGGGTTNITNNIIDKGKPCVTIDLNSAAAVVNVNYNSLYNCTSYSSANPEYPYATGPAAGVNINQNAVNGSTVNINYNLFTKMNLFGSNQSIINLYDKAGITVNYQVNYNNFSGVTADQYVYNVILNGDIDPNIQFNWWGTTNTSEIDNLIFDYNDNLGYNTVDYTNYLSGPSALSPISPVENFLAVDAGAGAIDLSWDQNPESDIAGYIIYYDTDSNFPYTGTGATEGDSGTILVVGAATNSKAITGLNTSTNYYFNVTAYDTGRDGTNDQVEGVESWFRTDALVYTNP